MFLLLSLMTIEQKQKQNPVIRTHRLKDGKCNAAIKEFLQNTLESDVIELGPLPAERCHFNEDYNRQRTSLRS